LSAINIQDTAQEFRIVLEGKLAGETVCELADTWAAALAEGLPRRLMVDISDLTDCDAAGRKLLRDMHLHGTGIAAKTTTSLDFLAEATAPRRPNVSALLESDRKALFRVAGAGRW
jgi:ABC-type transporter Mla MlaB component